MTIEKSPRQFFALRHLSIVISKLSERDESNIQGYLKHRFYRAARSHLRTTLRDLVEYT
jgi:hypothetical protein